MDNRSKFLLALIFLSLLFIGCYVPNDPSSRLEFSFGFKGRLEKLEDAFFNTNLEYKEFRFDRKNQSRPEYLFTINKNDTVVDYTISLFDCQSIFSLVKWNNDYKCDSSYVSILDYKHNLDTLPMSKAKKIFNDSIITSVRINHEKITDSYHWNIKRFGEDSVIVDILNQNKILRKRYFFSLDTIGNSIEEKEIVNHIGDTVIIYKNKEKQRFMYIESKQILHKDEYNLNFD